MNITIQKASERGGANHGWLDAKHYFSFGGYHNPEKVHFGLLRVLNDDRIAGGGAFPTHPHDNMEIITIPFTGALQHKDSTGGKGIIKSGDIQIMSAGTGVQHSEANASDTEEVTLFQVWIFPKQKNIKPRYDQRNFSINDRQNKWQIVVSPDEKDDALWINQDAKFALSSVESGEIIQYENGFKGNGIYLVVIDGSIEIEGKKLGGRDAAGISGTESISIKALENSELLVIEVPMN